MNPILARELRLRFRDKRSFWLLFGLALALCLAAASIYSNAINNYNFANPSRIAVPNSMAQRESQTGRELFRFLALGNTFAWLLIAPALTATGLAKERERGLLESLWLSPFRVRSQVLGRLGAALCFLLLLQVATLPIYGIAVLLGGVSPADLAFSGLIIAGAALVGASFGLFCSARSYRASSALGASFIGVAIWSWIGFSNAQSFVFGGTDWTNFAFAFSHPVALLWLLLSPNDFAPRFGGPGFGGGAFVPISAPDALWFGLPFQLLVSAILLWSATRKASKPLPDAKWSEGNTRLKKWKKSLDEAKAERQARLEQERASQKVAGALLYELPVEKFVRFKDPLLSREVRGRFRLRQSGFLVSLLRFGVFLIGIGFWLAVLFNALDKTTRSGAGPTLLLGLLTFGTLAVGVMSSGAIVREREAGTWEGLHLSLMSPGEIVRSKWLSPLVTFGYWSAPCWLLLPFCVDFDALGAVLVLIASLATVSAWGFLVSSRAPHSAAATSWTLASLLVFLAGFPVLEGIFAVSRNGYTNQFLDFQNRALRESYHPFLTIGNLFNNYPGDFSNIEIKWKIVVLNLLFNALLSAVLLFLVRARLRKTEA